VVPLTAGAIALALGIAAGAGPAGQGPAAFTGMLDEHPAIQYATRPTTDRVATLNETLRGGTRRLTRDAQTGYLRAVLDALGVPLESQLLVFSKTGIQRSYTGPANPRALYYDESVVVGYIPGAPALELASHDAEQGVVFYTLDQDSPSPAFSRRTNCLTCHVSDSTLEVPGIIVRSNIVRPDGQVLLQLGSHTVNHRTPHTQRWGGWFVTGGVTAPPYISLGHLGNITVTEHTSSGPVIHSDHAFIEWLNSDPDRRGYPAPFSDLAALMAFDHQMHAINLMTRLNWEARVAAADGRAVASDPRVRRLVHELADYLLFVGEAPSVVTVTPRAGFAERLIARFPRDRRGRSLAELDLDTRLLRYPCSYMVYTDAFEGLPTGVKDAVYRRMFDILSARVTGQQYAHLTAADRRAIREILQDTKRDLPIGTGVDLRRERDRDAIDRDGIAAGASLRR
jgi:hypothetical protein